jgi:mRNA interferase HigB
MNVLSLKKIKEYYTKNTGAKVSLTSWFKTTRKADWKDLNDSKVDFPSADLVKDDQVVFNIKGNHYRLIARISFPYKSVMVKWIGTHAEYDKIDAGTV